MPDTDAEPPVTYEQWLLVKKLFKVGTGHAEKHVVDPSQRNEKARDKAAADEMEDR